MKLDNIIQEEVNKYLNENILQLNEADIFRPFKDFYDKATGKPSLGKTDESMFGGLDAQEAEDTLKVEPQKVPTTSTAISSTQPDVNLYCDEDGNPISEEEFNKLEAKRQATPTTTTSQPQNTNGLAQARQKILNQQTADVEEAQSGLKYYDGRGHQISKEQFDALEGEEKKAAQTTTWAKKNEQQGRGGLYQQENLSKKQEKSQEPSVNAPEDKQGNTTSVTQGQEPQKDNLETSANVQDANTEDVAPHHVNKFGIDIEKYVNPHERNSISNALYRLMKDNYLDNSTIVFSMIRQLKQIGW